MNNDRIKKFVVNGDISIVEAMGKIDDNAKGILFVVDEKGILAGCVTDGDIRRWLIKTGDLNACIEKAMKRSPKYLFAKEKDRAKKFMEDESITAVPILNDQMIIQDVVLLSETNEKKDKKHKANLSDIPVVIMAGGKGTRLYPYTKILPKPLIPIGDTPILERIINCFTEYGIDTYYLTVNYKKGMIKSYFSDLAPNYTIKYVEENKPLGTGGSVKLIEDKIEVPFFVTNCDALILTDYSELYDYHKKAGNDITIVSALKNVVIPYGVLHSKENGELIDFEEKPRLSYFINTGMYVVNPDTIQEIPDDCVFHMTNLVEKIKNKGGKIGVYPVSEDSFLDMGEFDEMHRMEKKLNIVVD